MTEAGEPVAAPVELDREAIRAKKPMDRTPVEKRVNHPGSENLIYGRKRQKQAAGNKPDEPAEWKGLPLVIREMKWVQSFKWYWDNEAQKGYRKIWKEDPKGFVAMLAKLEDEHFERVRKEREKAMSEEWGDEKLLATIERLLDEGGWDE